MKTKKDLIHEVLASSSEPFDSKKILTLARAKLAQLPPDNREALGEVHLQNVYHEISAWRKEHPRVWDASKTGPKPKTPPPRPEDSPPTDQGRTRGSLRAEVIEAMRRAADEPEGEADKAPERPAEPSQAPPEAAPPSGFQSASEGPPGAPVCLPENNGPPAPPEAGQKLAEIVEEDLSVCNLGSGKSFEVISPGSFTLSELLAAQAFLRACEGSPRRCDAVLKAMAELKRGM